MRIVVLVSVLLVGCSMESGESGSERGDDNAQRSVEPVTVVDTAPVQTGSVADTLTSSAVVESEAKADLIPEASGVVKSVHKDEGDVVRKGDLLAVLANVSLGTGAERSSAEVARLEMQVAESRKLAAQGALSERDLREMEFQLQTARLSAREASAGYGSTRLTAPFDGVVAMRDVRVGELASAGRAAFTVVDLDDLRVVASLPERDLKRVKVGQPAKLVSAYDTEVWTEGVVERIAPVIDASSGTFRVTVGLDPSQQALRPGQFVSVSLEVDRHEGVRVVPKKAVVYEDGAPIVYVVVPAPEPEDDEADDEEAPKTASWWPFGGGDDEEASDDEGSEADEEEDEGEALVARRTPIELGLVDAEWAEVLDGLQGDEIVITVGQTHLRDGARVRPTDDEPAEAAEAAPADDDGAGDKG